MPLLSLARLPAVRSRADLCLSNPSRALACAAMSSHEGVAYSLEGNLKIAAPSLLSLLSGALQRASALAAAPAPAV